MILVPMPTNRCSISLGGILTILVALSLVPQKMFSQRRATVVFSNRILCVEPKNSIPYQRPEIAETRNIVDLYEI